MGNNFATLNWPAGGEMDVLKHVNAASALDWNKGSIHGPGFTGDSLGTQYDSPPGQTASGWHSYGMIWSKDRVSYYVDDPRQPYVTYTTSSLNRLIGAAWPFDGGQASFIILNVAVGGSWPRSPNAGTPFSFAGACGLSAYLCGLNIISAQIARPAPRRRSGQVRRRCQRAARRSVRW